MSKYHPPLLAALLVGTALSLAPVAPRPAAAQAAAQQFALSIPAQPLPQALAALSADTGLQVYNSSEAAYALRSNAVNGTYSTDQALARMLAGTGATARRVGQNGITISVAGEAASGGAAVPDGAVVLDTVTITAGGGASEGSGSYSHDTASMARGATSLRDVPQSVTVITRQAVEDQNLTDMSRVMAKAPGIVANREDNGNPNYYSRGFKINNYQIDQLGTSYDSSFRPDFDMSIYDRVEILRGAEGLFSGSGEPGGSVNLARKRPTADLQSSVALSSGSWSNHRIEADISGPLALDGALRGRLVGAWQDREFFYSPSDEKKHVLYGILEYDLAPDTVVHAGVSYQKRQGVTWTGGIPGYLDGTLPDLDRGIALTTDWARSDHTVKEVFAGIEHRFSPDWTLRASAMAQDYAADMLWLVMAGPLSPDGDRFNQISSSYQESGNRSKAVDVSLDGRFDMWGRQHKLLVGADWRQSRARQHGYALDQEVFPEVIGLDNLSDLNLIRPNVTVPFSIWPGYGSTQRGIYARLELQANDSLRFVLGGRYGDYEYDSRHERYDENGNLTAQTRTGYRDTGILTPYAAAIYDLNQDWSVYASLTDIYKVQANNLAGPPENPTPLDPITGRNYELGAKGELLGGALATSVALYRIERKGEAADDLRYPYEPDGTGSSCCYIAQGKIVSQGLDLELSGELSPGWQVFMGYTYNHNKDDDSNQTYSALTPRHMLKLWTSYDLPGDYSRWTVGGGVTVKSRHANSGRFWYNNPDASVGWEERDYEIRQGGFAVWDAQVQYRIDDQWNLALNVNNVFDKRYFSAIGHPRGSNWYGEPRNAALTLRGRF